MTYVAFILATCFGIYRINNVLRNHNVSTMMLMMTMMMAVCTVHRCVCCSLKCYFTGSGLLQFTRIWFLFSNIAFPTRHIYSIPMNPRAWMGVFSVTVWWYGTKYCVLAQSSEKKMVSLSILVWNTTKTKLTKCTVGYEACAPACVCVCMSCDWDFPIMRYSSMSRLPSSKPAYALTITLSKGISFSIHIHV